LDLRAKLKDFDNKDLDVSLLDNFSIEWVGVRSTNAATKVDGKALPPD
jgi:hypothetical protein